MNIKSLEKRLRDYKRKKSILETTLSRIEVYENAISNPDEFNGLYLGKSKEVGMPSGKGFKCSSPVEFDILSKEDEIQRLKEWIKEDKSKIYMLQIEMEQLTAALNAITNQKRYIVECKYFEKMFWRDIEISFNNKFRQQNYISTEGIRKLNRQALYTLSEILSPFYDRINLK